jgi:HAD superfamily hydrolase (TIGR01490 family)
MTTMNLALFDLDNTLLHGDSDHAWGEFLVEEGIVDREDFRRSNDRFYAQYRAGTLDINEYLRFALRVIAGKSDALLAPLHQRYMQKKIEPMVSAEALALLQQHRHDLCAIVTATNAFVTRPIAARFAVEHLIACEVEQVDGLYTGRAAGVPAFREGKVTRVEAWLGAMHKSIGDFERSYFYSDSHNDLPLLEAVTHPVAVNPDAILRTRAEARGWPIMSLRQAAGVAA